MSSTGSSPKLDYSKMMSFLSIEKPQGQLLMALELLGTLTSKVIMAAGATASKSSFLNKTFMT